MKAISFLTLIALIAPALAQNEAAVNAQKTAEKAAETSQQLAPNQQAFLNLPEEMRNKFIKHFNEAGRLFQQKRVFETLEEIEQAAKIFKDSPELYNLRGSCMVEMRSFDKALADFRKALTYTKENPSVEFNVAEVLFVMKNWKEALKVFEKIQKTTPVENVSLARLIEFKSLLCKKKLGMKKEVALLVEKYDFMDDSPFFYYANATVAYDAKDLVKAEEWLAIAARVFPDPNALAPWQDTLVEYGYIKSFYGEDSGE